MEQAAFAPPERFSPSEWSDRYAQIPNNKPHSGRYRLAPTQYLAGIMDAVEEPDVREIVIVKSARIGYSTMLANLLGWIADQQPGPTLLVMPDENYGRKIIEEDIRPALTASPQVTRLLREMGRKENKETIQFFSCTVNLGWSGSPTSLGGRSIRWAIIDEADKGQSYSGRDADYVNLTRTRTVDWQHRGRVIIGSTPTTREGHVWRAYQQCGDKRKYHVPCPHCGEFQALVFPRVKFDQPEVKAITDRSRRADYVQANNVAYYECEHCKGHIFDQHKPAMILAGVWLSEGQTIDKQGAISGERPRSPRVGFHINALYSPFVTFSRLASEFLRSQGDIGALFNFRTQWLGEIFEEIVTAIKVDDLRAAIATAPVAEIVPRWAAALVTTVDTQKSQFFYTIRAWGGEYRSQLVRFGVAATFEEVRRLGLETPYRIAGIEQTTTPRLLLIDSGGHRTNEVYDFAKSDKRIIPSKGAASYAPTKTIQYSTAINELGLSLVILDSQYFKSRLATLRDAGKFGICNSVTEDYLDQLASEVMVPDHKSGRLIWRVRYEGIDNHYLDCEAMQCAAADMLQVAGYPTEDVLSLTWAQEKKSNLNFPSPVQEKQGWFTESKKSVWG